MCTAPVGIIIDRVRSGDRRAALLWSLLLLAFGARAQRSDSSVTVSLSGYLEAYFAYDLGRPESNERPTFLYSHKRHNEVAINLVLLKASVGHERWRGNLALMAGTYPQYNLAHEPQLMRSVLEANAGIRLSKRGALWFDVGVLPSHIGFESAITADCWTLTRSLWAENTPYYEAGARLSTRPNERWYIAALYLNGWQRMQRQAGNSVPHFGTQVSHITSNGTLVNWSTFIGSDVPDSLYRHRIYNNLYAVFDGDTTGLTMGFDIGMQQDGEGGWNSWFGPLVVLRQRLSRTVSGVLRGEFFSDEARVIVGTERPLTSATLGFEHRLSDAFLWRAETRWIGNELKIFTDTNGSPSRANWAITTALSARF